MTFAVLESLPRSLVRHRGFTGGSDAKTESFVEWQTLFVERSEVARAAACVRPPEDCLDQLPPIPIPCFEGSTP